MKLTNLLGRRSAVDPEVARLKAQAETMSFRLEEASSQLTAMQSLLADDRGWSQIAQDADEVLTPAGRKTISDLCRAFAIQNPLIKRGLTIRAGYVWGQGVGVQARSTGTEDGEQDVNKVIQAFLDDPGNRRAFTGGQAREEAEKTLGTDGNVFAVLFSNPQTGFVSARTIDSREITDQITNPDDRSETWFFRRDYVERTLNRQTSKTDDEQRTVWYPALGHTPKRRMTTIDGDPVRWDAPIYQVRVNTPTGSKWGIGDAYAAIPWARAYKEFLEDWAALMKALSRIAWKISGKRSAAQQARAAIRDMTGAAQTAAMDPATQLEAVPKTGATIDAESGRPLATMIAAALGLPVTTLLADPGQTGARAVAETLDQPTRLEMQGRREVWTEALRAILGHVIDQAILAPAGPLDGSIVTDPYTGQQEVVLAGDQDRTLVFHWPDLDETSPEVLVKAIADADATGKLPPLETMRLLLRALGVRDVDEIVDEWTDDDGNWIDPATSAGDAAVAAFDRGDDPAAAVKRKT